MVPGDTTCWSLLATARACKLFQMLEFAPAVYKSLHGLFAVYKPPGVKWKMIRDTVETRLLEGLNSLKQPLPQQQVRFLPEPVEESSGSEVIITAIKVPALADHPLVKGPAFKRLKVGAGHLLDVKSSGVFEKHLIGQFESELEMPQN
ncbi:mitochondrial mRNA pseudouridine synthase Trub2-like [Protopterus annectens]|uniref:mitochondrial mRNA pseudouridine synthase Trub2-like n=1 Tax=Protopterus annectens TaxID=7888 RepID=UPI001CF9917E|nr:mitochondrial mRNA pseudouridine synthase Trub2-like [Protopterus annectens]